MWLDRYVSEVNSRARLVRFINESFRFCELHKLIFGNITISEISVKVFSKKKTKKQFNGVISIEWSNLHSLSLHWKLAEWQHFWMTYPFNIHISKWHLGVFFSFFCFPFIHAVLVPIFRPDRFHCVSIQLSLGLF